MVVARLRGDAHDWLLWLENTAWAVSIRQSPWLYPWLEIVHIAGITLVAGAAMLFDLRLLGFSRRVPVSSLAGYLLPWSRRGLLLVVPSGVLLFLTNAGSIGTDPVFGLKMLLLACAAGNALAFHRFTWQPAAAWQQHGAVPLKAKAAALVSVAAWLAIIACGRLLAY